MELPKRGDLLLGKYVVDEPLGEGGMGVVYSARHNLLGQRFALKFLHPAAAADGQAVARFLNEARAAARIENEHVGRVLDVGMLESGLPYMVLEYLDGADLSTVLQRGGPLPIHDVADYLLQAIEGVAHAHALGIVHRDLKPSNLFIARRPDGTARVKVLDFGISKILGGDGAHAMTQSRSLLGSPRYMPPEQLLDPKSVDHRCDIWSFGVVAYELLTGVPPFDADNAVALFSAIQRADAPRMRTLRPEIPAGLDDAVHRCLQRELDARFASVTELGAALVPFGSAIGARAFENARRILPVAPPEPAAAPVDDVATAPTVRNPASPPVAHAGEIETAAPWSSSRSSRAPRGRVWIAIGAGVGGIAVLGALWLRPRHHPMAGAEPVRVHEPSAPTSIAPPPSAVETVAATAPPAPSAAPSHTVTAPARAAGTSRSKPPHAAASSSARPQAPNCTPPYDVDEKGNRRWKLECL
jgi:serine/threonine-protein kinase